MTAPSRQRRVPTVEIVPALRSRRAAGLALLAALCAYVAFAVCAAVATPIGLAICAVLVAAAELLLDREAAIVVWAVQRVGLGPTSRGLARAVLLVLFAARTTSTALTVCVAVAGLLIAGVEALRAGLAQVIEFWRLPLILSRGVPLTVPGVPSAPRPWTLHPGGLAAVVTVPAAIGLALSTGSTRVPGIVGLLVALALAAAVAALLAGHALTLRRHGVRGAVSAEVRRRLIDLAPEVAVYLGGGPGWRYQGEMWLQTVEQLGRPAVVIVRDWDVLRLLAPTRLPVVCIANGSILMQLELPALRTVLYVGNTGDSIHMLRRPGVSSVFVGHGDSDKPASSNPFARVYDEIWVAGAAGRDRYLSKGVAVPADTIIEVGRPQLGELGRAPDAQPRLTVLYAPTWDGWGDEPYHTSLPHVGPDLIRALLARPELRVMYRPHPQTGSRDAVVRRAHEEVLRLMRAAGAQSAPAEIGRPPSGAASVDGDLLDLALAGPLPWSRADHDAAVARWNADYWAALPGHRILTAPAPDLHACFAYTDVLIADVSSVTSDFLATDRPFATLNTTGLPAAEFQARIPTSAGGFVLDAELSQLDALLAAARPGASDPTAAARTEARAYLLGPRTPDPAQTFRAQVDRLCAPRDGFAAVTSAAVTSGPDGAPSQP